MALTPELRAKIEDEIARCEHNADHSALTTTHRSLRYQAQLLRDVLAAVDQGQQETARLQSERRVVLASEQLSHERAEAADASLQALQQELTELAARWYWLIDANIGYRAAEHCETVEEALKTCADAICGLATLTQPGAAPRVTFTVRCNYCGHLPCDCTEQPGAAGQE